MKEINAPASATAAFMTGIGTILNYLPEAFGAVSSFFAMLLAFQLWRNKRLENKILKKELEEE